MFHKILRHVKENVFRHIKLELPKIFQNFHHLQTFHLSTFIYLRRGKTPALYGAQTPTVVPSDTVPGSALVPSATFPTEPTRTQARQPGKSFRQKNHRMIFDDFCLNQLL